MKQFASKAKIVNWAGSAALVATIALVTTAQAGQDPQARNKGGMTQKMTQKGREKAASAVSPAPDPAVASPERTACETGTPTACRAIEAGLASGGAWRWTDGGITAMDDWESPVARQASPTSTPAPPQTSGNPIPSAVLVQRVLAACDAGDATACRAFAASVQERDTRTYTGGRRNDRP